MITEFQPSELNVETTIEGRLESWSSDDLLAKGFDPSNVSRVSLYSKGRRPPSTALPIGMLPDEKLALCMPIWSFRKMDPWISSVPLSKSSFVEIDV